MALSDLLNKFRDDRSQMLIKLETARQRREDLQTLPLPLDEHVDKMCRLVDSNAEHFSVHLKRRTEAYINNPLGDMGSMLALLVDGSQGDQTRIQHMICGLFPDQVKEGLRRTAQTWDWPKAGPPRHEREAEMAKLDKTIADLENKLREADSKAEQYGIEIGQARGDHIKHQGLGRAPNPLRKG